VQIVTDPFFICQARLPETGKDTEATLSVLIFTIGEIGKQRAESSEMSIDRAGCPSIRAKALSRAKISSAVL